MSNDIKRLEPMNIGTGFPIKETPAQTIKVSDYRTTTEPVPGEKYRKLIRLRTVKRRAKDWTKDLPTCSLQVDNDTVQWPILLGNKGQEEGLKYLCLMLWCMKEYGADFNKVLDKVSLVDLMDENKAGEVVRKVLRNFGKTLTYLITEGDTQIYMLE